MVCEADEKKVPQLQLIMRELEELGIPRFLFLNKIDKADANPERVKSNLEVFDFELTDAEMATLNGLDEGTRFRPDPETYTGP